MPQARPPAPRLAEEWSGRVGKIARNLTDFNDSDEARRVRARLADPAAPYLGRSLEQARRASSALQGLWQDYLVLSRVVDEALALSRRSGFLSNRDEEVHALLEGPSVRLPSVSVPVARRGLLDAAETEDRLTPRDVLDSMRTVFTVARDTFSALVAAEDGIAGRAVDLRARAEAVAAWQASAKVDVGAGAFELTALDAIAGDPLSGLDRLERMQSSVAAAESRRIEADRAIAALRARLGSGAEGLAALRQAARDLDAASADSLRVVDGAAIPAAADETGPLADWLGSLRRFVAEGSLQAAGVGLGKWETALREARARIDAATEAVRAPAAQLDDLRGVFRALRAKGASLRFTDGAGIEERAKTVLRTEPVRLGEARALVKAYEVALARAGDATGGRS